MHFTQPFAETQGRHTIDISYISLDLWDWRQFSRIRVKPTSAIVYCLNEAERKRSASLWAKFNTFLPSTDWERTKRGKLAFWTTVRIVRMCLEKPVFLFVFRALTCALDTWPNACAKITRATPKQKASHTPRVRFSLSMFSQIKIWMPAVSRYFR